LPIAGFASAVAALDLDRDGLRDLAVATSTTQGTVGTALKLVRQQPGFTFVVAESFGPSGGIDDLAAGDLDQDGLDDIALLHGTLGVLLFRNDGGGALAQLGSLGGGGSSIAAVDLDGDGDREIAVLSSGSLAAFPNLGGFAFGGAITWPIGGGLSGTNLVMKDLNGDGDPDAAIGQSNGGSVSLLFGQPGLAFAAPTTVFLGSSPLQVALGDVDGDGMPDLLAALDDERALGFRLNVGGGQFGPFRRSSVGGPASLLAVGDLDRDGWDDALIGGASFDGLVRLVNRRPELDSDGDGIPDCAEAPCPADLDLDGEVGGADLAALLAAWGACRSCAADLDGSGHVGAADLTTLLAAWGPCAGGL
jgi:hypothetical protein